AARGSGLWVPRWPALTVAAIRQIRPETGSARSGAWRFFQLRPALLDPAFDGLVVAFDRAPRWPLAGPVQLVAKHVPDVAWVVRHAGNVLDHLGNPRQRPHVRQVSVGCRALHQRVLDLSEL